MALGKHFEEITERRAINNAAVVFEYQHPQASAKRIASSESPDENYRIPPREIAAFRLFAAEANRRFEERWARERVLVYALSEVRTAGSPAVVGYLPMEVGFIPLREAVKEFEEFHYEIIHLDDMYAGMTVHAGHILISETMAMCCLNKYGSADLLDGAAKEKRQRLAAAELAIA